jgi:hypothetical protein
MRVRMRRVFVVDSGRFAFTAAGCTHRFLLSKTRRLDFDAGERADFQRHADNAPRRLPVRGIFQEAQKISSANDISCPLIRAPCSRHSTRCGFFHDTPRAVQQFMPSSSSEHANVKKHWHQVMSFGIMRALFLLMIEGVFHEKNPALPLCCPFPDLFHGACPGSG